MGGTTGTDISNLTCYPEIIYFRCCNHQGIVFSTCPVIKTQTDSPVEKVTGSILSHYASKLIPQRNSTRNVPVSQE